MRQWMMLAAKLYERQGTQFLHASPVELAVGTVLEPHRERRANGVVEHLFESLRPSAKLSRHNAVFMTETYDAIEVMGLTDEDAFLYLVEPRGPTFRYDWAWTNRAELVYEQSYRQLDPRIEKQISRFARAYWAGKQSPDYPDQDGDEQLGGYWEILTATATVIASA